MDISALGAASGASAATAASEASLADSFDTFLTLLTTQLRYQDPLEPMDSSEFTNQLVQFTEVEQSISTNKQLGQLIGMQGTNQAVAAISYIGNQIEALSSDLPLTGGAAQLNYVLPENASSANVLIFNASGQLVRSIEGNTTVGRHAVTWDGLSNDGTEMADGLYTVAVAAQNADKKALNVPTTIVGTVTGTQSDETGAYLAVGPALIGLDKIVSVTKPPAQES